MLLVSNLSGERLGEGAGGQVYLPATGAVTAQLGRYRVGVEHLWRFPAEPADGIRRQQVLLRQVQLLRKVIDDPPGGVQASSGLRCLVLPSARWRGPVDEGDLG